MDSEIAQREGTKSPTKHQGYARHGEDGLARQDGPEIATHLKSFPQLTPG
jgi:hypothetical protein